MQQNTKLSKKDLFAGKHKAKPEAVKNASLPELRSWIPCEEFCEMYRLPKRRSVRDKPAKYPTSNLTACRKVCERLSRKNLIETQRIDGRLYVSRESAIQFGNISK